MSTSIQIAAEWPGFSAIRRFIIFGDSYSSVGYNTPYTNRQPNRTGNPSAKWPLCVPFPGDVHEMWNEPNKANWVGHLLTTYLPKPRFDPTAVEPSSEWQDNPALVFDYAVGGETVEGVKRQVQNKFLSRHSSPKPETWMPDNSLFVTWVGINDNAFRDSSVDTAAKFKIIFELQEDLYDVGARNFLLVDLPPIHRCPAVPMLQESHIGTKFGTWNRELTERARTFASTHADVTVLVYSSWATFTGILDSPEAHGFGADTIRKGFSDIWYDQLHPTTKVHEFVAKDLSEFLASVGLADKETTQ